MKAAVPFLLGVVVSTQAVSLGLPSNARLTGEKTTANDRYAVPIAPFDGIGIKSINLDGAVQRQAWQIPGEGQTTLQMITPLKSELEANGFQLAFDCISEQCGGFDFRFGIETLEAPAVYVNLSDFQFLSFFKGPKETPEAAVTILLSTTREASYVQVIEVTQNAVFQTRPTVPDTSVVSNPSSPDLSGPDNFLASGAMVLEGVDFGSGATTLGDGPFPFLDSLAKFLTDNPTIQIALVGHTDSVGSLDSNIRVSRARAQAVKNRLTQEYGVQANRIEAQGAGYLSPIASNLSENGRAQNRRVEAVILRARQ